MTCCIQWQWLNANGPAVQALATGVLVLVTIVYACLTRRTAKAAEENARAARKLAESTDEMKIASVRPVVVALWRYMDVYGGVRHLLLVNVGVGPALHVLFRFATSKAHLS